jgi:hypothetical protein
VSHDNPSKSANKKPPEEEQIAAWLADFKPQPSARFYQRMESAPWVKTSRAAKKVKNQPGWIARLSGAPSLRIAAAAAALLAFIIIGTLASPALRAVAQQLMHFFIPAQDDRISVQVTMPFPGEAGSFESADYFSLSLSEAQSLAGFPIKEITRLPPGYAFSGAHFDPTLKAAALRYSDHGSFLVLTQRPSDKVEEYFSVGASAAVETVEVHGVQGEYVTGGWRVTPQESARIETAVPGTQVSLGAYWDPSLPQETLRWQEAGMAYEIRAAGADRPNRDELLEMAGSIR